MPTSTAPTSRATAISKVPPASIPASSSAPEKPKRRETATSTPRTPALFGTARDDAYHKVGESFIAELRYWLLALAIIPLAMSLFSRDDDVVRRIKHSIKHLAQSDREIARDQLEEYGGISDELIQKLPEQRLDGAYLSQNSHMHWAFAGASAFGYLMVILLLFPLGKATTPQLLSAGLFTATVGIFLLLAFQFLAMFMLTVNVSNVIVAFLQFIAIAYVYAEHPGSGIITSFLAFTFSAGLCEEFCKGFIVFRHFRKYATLDWRGACVLGLASGVGFGVAEGIHYAGSYNGVAGAEIYWQRFVSCVGLHAIWSAAVGLAAWRYRDDLKKSWWTIFRIIWAPMIMHGLYDTLLTKDHPGAAVLCAIAGFAWLAYQFERTYLEQNREQKLLAQTAAA